jgi:hypothetical protein
MLHRILLDKIFETFGKLQLIRVANRVPGKIWKSNRFHDIIDEYISLQLGFDVIALTGTADP